MEPSNFYTGEDEIDLLDDKEVSKLDVTGLDEHTDLRYSLYQMRNNLDSP